MTAGVVKSAEIRAKKYEFLNFFFFTNERESFDGLILKERVHPVLKKHSPLFSQSSAFARFHHRYTTLWSETDPNGRKMCALVENLWNTHVIREFISRTTKPLFFANREKKKTVANASLLITISAAQMAETVKSRATPLRDATERSNISPTVTAA